MPAPRPRLIAGNWKMHGLSADLAQIAAVADGLGTVPPHITALICPPATLIATAAHAARGSRLHIGAQNVSAHPPGAHTGENAAAMLADAGASHVIVGHSERRLANGETDAAVRAKAEAAQAAGLTPIICVGESARERDAGQTLAIIAAQLEGSLPPAGYYAIAYEPIWAIGTGRTPTDAQVAEVHALIRAHAGPAPALLYGGSVKPDNAARLLAIANVDGALVGGASLNAADFLAILAAA